MYRIMLLLSYRLASARCVQSLSMSSCYFSRWFSQFCPQGLLIVRKKKMAIHPHTTIAHRKKKFFARSSWEQMRKTLCLQQTSCISFAHPYINYQGAVSSSVQAAVTRLLQTGWLIINRNWFLTVQEPGNLRSVYQRGQERAFFCRLLLYPHMAERAGELCRISFTRALIPFTRPFIFTA